MSNTYKKYGLLGSVAYSRFATPISTLSVRCGIGPNVITVLGLVFFVAGCALLLSDRLLLAASGFALLHFGVTLDYVDGIVARSTNSTSFFGAWLDNSIDRIADFVLMLPIAIDILENYSSQWVKLVVLVNIFAVCFFHYIHDIGYFYRSATSGEPLAPGTGGRFSKYISLFVSGWLRLFNRDTIVFILSLSLLVKVTFVPFAAVFIVTIINLLLHGAKELARK